MRKYKNKKCLVGGTVGAVFVASILLSYPTYAEGSTLSLTVSPTITLNLSGVSTTRNSGTSSPTAENIKVSTNNYTGYTLSIAGALATASPLANTDAACTTPESCQIASIASDSTYTSPVDFSSNTWGYKTTIYNGSTWDNVANNPNGYYLASPTTTAAVLDATSTANDVDNAYNLTLGAKIDSSLQPGTYSGTFVITAVANPIPYSITYANAEGITDVANMPSPNPQTGSGVASVTLSSAVPVREGYSFGGWCTVVPTTIDDMDSCAGTIYQAGGEYALNQTGGGGNTATLYAIWVKTLADISTMQEVTSEICANTPTPLASDGASTPQYQLEDARDHKIYWVAKLADEKCWMTQNLDLSIPADGLSALDTDIVVDWNSSSTTPPTSTLTDASQYNDDNNTTSVDSWDAGDWYYDGATNLSCGSEKLTYEGCTGFSGTGDAHYHVGNMYSWGAATAGTGGAINSGEAEGSICPKGWRLPTGGSSGEFATLQVEGNLSYTVQNWLDSPYYFTRTGELRYDSDKLSDAGSYGGYWSSTPYSDSSITYGFRFVGTSDLFSVGLNIRAVGLSVRCVVR